MRQARLLVQGIPRAVATGPSRCLLCVPRYPQSGSRPTTTAVRSVGYACSRSQSQSQPQSPIMLRGAVEKHAQKHSAPASTGRSTWTNTGTRLSTNQNTNNGSETLFKLAAPSVSNGLSSPTRRAQCTAGMKRNADGLCKTLSGSFEDTTGSQHKPIAIDDASPVKGKMVQLTPNVFVDENDFDSDIDLDYEEPTAIPSAPAQTASTVRPIVYPTLPRQQEAQTSILRDIDSVLETGSPAHLQSTLPSSAALPWSSSPVEHLRPTPIAASASVAQPSFKDVTSQYINQPVLPQRPSQPIKRRKIPWLSESPPLTIEEENEAATTNGERHRRPSKIETSINATPKEKPSSHLWNTTASAVKEQQKKHREQTKKTTTTVLPDAGELVTGKAKTSRARLARVFLSDEQQHVLDLVVEKKKSVFFTGSAGTGKSVLMREIISKLRARYSKEPDRVAVTASTGLAASNVGGVTLHSFAGIGLGKEDVPELVRKIKRNQKAKHRWLRTKVLVIDEVSMVDGDLFDKLEAIARQIRNNGRPFGGIQLVITGDFFQLPPVPDSGRSAKFAFDAATWSTTVEHTIGLHHVFRQKDPVFASMLNEMREGRLSQSSIAAFQKLNRPLEFEDQLECTELYPRREDVDRANWERLNSLQGQTYVFEARDAGAIVDKPMRDKLLSNCMAPESISLKKGAQVMLIKNVDESLVNGSLGQVMGLMDEQQFDRYDALDDNPSTASNPGLQSKRHVDNVTSGRRWPVVRFLLADGSTRDLLCQPETWKVELPNGEVQASRAQVPLILAWALSIHKAQGQTLDRVKVDLGKVFEKGQAYVALSRATSMAGLQVLRFDPKKVVAHDRVRHFYANLTRVELASKSTE